MATGVQSDASAQRLRRRCRFRLKPLLFLLTACGLALGWCVIHRDIAKARVNYEYAEIKLEIGRTTHKELCEASVAVREAECRMPFYSHRAAGAEHFARMLKLKIRTEAMVPLTMYDDRDEPARILETIDRYCEEAEQWLAEQ